jgi:hypothetical protein
LHYHYATGSIKEINKYKLYIEFNLKKY